MPIIQDIALLLLKMGAGLATVGGVLGLFYAVRALKERPFKGAHKELAVVMLLPTMLGAILALASWFITAVLHPTITFALTSAPVIFPIEFEGTLIRGYLFAPLAWSLLCVAGFFLLRYKSKHTWIRYEVFYGLTVFISLLLFLTPIILFRDLYGLYIMLELVSTVLASGSIALTVFLYLRARIERTRIKELLDGIFVARRLFWASLLLNTILLVITWDRRSIYYEDFTIGQILVASFGIIGVLAFEWVLPRLSSKKVIAHWQWMFTLLVSSLVGLLVTILLFAEIEFIPISTTLIPWISFGTVVGSTMVGALIEWFGLKHHRLW